MLTFRKFCDFDFNSPVIRRLLSLYYRPGRYYRIPFGQLAGIKIWYDRSINYHAILGLWERSSFKTLEKVLVQLTSDRKSVQFFDIGANIGLYSLYVGRFSKKTKVVAFEPVKETVKRLKDNLTENGIQDIKILENAVSNKDGEVNFYLGHHHKSSLYKEWTSDRGATQVNEIKVNAVKLDTFVKQNAESVPDFIKIDVEGAGGKVLEGGINTFKTSRPIILIESHLSEEDRAIIDMMKECDYETFRINDQKWVKNPESDYHDPEGVWGTMLLFPREKVPEFNKVLK
jgi:FkbM family methyltransferase